MYGIYDPHANRGSLFVGVSHETSAFAVTSIRRWWGQEGRQRYPRAQRLLILADTGGSNAASRGAWQDHLQQQLCDQYGLTVTVAHYPTGASKYNPIERRLCSQISNHWAGEPPVSYEKILKFIRTTKTSTGLRVTVCLDRRDYPVGVKPSAEGLCQLRQGRTKMELYPRSIKCEIVSARPLSAPVHEYAPVFRKVPFTTTLQQRVFASGIKHHSLNMFIAPELKIRLRRKRCNGNGTS